MKRTFHLKITGALLFILLSLLPLTSCQKTPSTTNAKPSQNSEGKEPTEPTSPAAPAKVAANEPQGNQWQNALKPRGEGVTLNLQASGPGSYKIWTPEAPTTQEQFAATTLQEALLKMTKIEVPIVKSNTPPEGRYFSLGGTTAEKALGGAATLAPDGYQIRHKEGNWYLTGGTMRGPINAVLALLEEDLGWRHYSINVPQSFPDLTGKPLTIVPRHFNPAFEVREFYIREGWNAEWALLNRSAPMCDPVAQQIPENVGGSKHYPVGNWFAHTFSRLAPDAETFQTHPEYFAEKGARVQDDICLTNPETVKIVAANALKVIDTDPKATFFGIAQNDGLFSICQCANCKALEIKEGSAAGPNLNFVNQVAKIIHKKYPKIKVTTLAYMETYRAPKTIRPEENVVVFFATDQHTFDNPFHRISETAKVQSALKAWSDLGTEIHIWDYTFGDNNNVMNPAPNFDIIESNFRHYAKNKNVKGVFCNDNFSGIGATRAAMKNWVLTKLLWNPEWEVLALERDFTLRYYGDAAEAMQKYNELQRQEWKAYHHKTKAFEFVENPEVRGYHERIRPPGEERFKVSESYLPEAIKLIDQAKAAVAKDPLLTAEVEREEACLVFQRLQKGGDGIANKEAYRADLQKMRKLCDKLGINSFGEGAQPETRFKTWDFWLNHPKGKPATPHTIQLCIDTVNLPTICGPATASIVDDPLTESKVTIFQPGPKYHWSIQWALEPMRFKIPNEKYVVRVHARLGKLKQPEGNVFHVGLYSPEKGTTFTREVTVKELSADQYRWINAGTITPHSWNMNFYGGATDNSAAEEIYIDTVELIPESEYKQLQEKPE